MTNQEKIDIVADFHAYFHFETKFEAEVWNEMREVYLKSLGQEGEDELKILQPTEQEETEHFSAMEKTLTMD